MGIYYGIYCGDIFAYIQFDSARIKPPPCTLLCTPAALAVSIVPLLPPISPLPDIIPFLHIFGIISATPALIPPYIPPTTIYSGYCRRPAHPATTHTPAERPPGGGERASGEELPPTKISPPNGPPDTPLL